MAWPVVSAPSDQSLPGSLAEAAVTILETPAPTCKVQLSLALAEDWRNGRLTRVGTATPPDRPARPARPELRPARDMPKRRIGGPAGRAALLHALAHIELNAIDLAWDIVARFAAAEDLPRAFHDDWVKVAAEEARHHDLLCRRMRDLDVAYGDLPAHDGLWQAAQETAHDLLARLAVVPLVLEARGLDVTPAMIEKFAAAGDQDSREVLEVIYRDEIGHVAIGKRWFDHLAQARGLEPKQAWQDLVRRHFKGTLKPPFNQVGRDQADFPDEYYRPLAESDSAR